MAQRLKPHRLKNGDTVVVIAGRDKGARGKVLRLDLERGRAIVEGVNVVKRHTAPTPRDPSGGIIEKEASVHISNLMLLDSKSDKPTRVRYGHDSDGKKGAHRREERCGNRRIT